MKSIGPLGLVLVCLLVTSHGRCKHEIHRGYRVLLEVPAASAAGFIGRAVLMETTAHTKEEGFAAALTVEAVGGRYSCALEALLGDVRVWSSGHYSTFFTTDECVVELSHGGDLRLKGPDGRIGWRTGTSGQGVQKLKLLKNGNMILTDAMNRVKWQSFHFPTDVLLLGQRVAVATWLAAFPNRSDPNTFYSLEIEARRIALYMNSGTLKYSYWNFRLAGGSNISFVELGSTGLGAFDETQKMIGKISSTLPSGPIQFLALRNETGNLGLYCYSKESNGFEASFQALDATCDLPMACKPYSICTFTNGCSCIGSVTARAEAAMVSGCSEGFPGGFCGGRKAAMVELGGVTSVLRDSGRVVNVSKERCSALCLADCRCLAALSPSEEVAGGGLRDCFLYRSVVGVRQIPARSGLNYLLKVPMESGDRRGRSSGPKKWVLEVVGVVDGAIISLVTAALACYVIWDRRRRILRAEGGDI